MKYLQPFTAIATTILSATLLFTTPMAYAEDQPESTDGVVSLLGSPQGGFGAAILTAVIDSDSTIARGSGVTSAASFGFGNYEVIFKRNIRNCAYSATLSESGSSTVPAPGSIGITGRSANVKGVFVNIDDIDGLGVEGGFTVVINCHK